MALDKKNIIICHGHLYLFWSTGVYYTAELAKKYHVVLLVPQDYKNDYKFISICRHLDINEIIYYNYSAKNLIQHFRNKRQFTKLLLKYKPDFLAQHDYIGIDNMYLFHLSKTHVPKCTNFVVTTSFPSNENTDKFNSQFTEISVERYSNRLKIPKSIIYLIRKFVIYLISFWTNVFLPTIVLVKSPYFPISKYTNIDIVPKRKLFDYYFVYSQCEKNYLDGLFDSLVKNNETSQHVISSPIIDIHNINNFLYEVHEEKIVSISPSLIGFRDFKYEEPTLKKWIEALNIIKKQLPDFKFLIKFHPGNKSNYIDVIKKYFIKECPFLEIYDNSMRAEELMLNSKIILGDVSTTLWWSNFRNNKLVISLGMKDYAGSKDMTLYKNILYYENMNDLYNVDFQMLLNNMNKNTLSENHPLLTDILESIL